MASMRGQWRVRAAAAVWWLAVLAGCATQMPPAGGTATAWVCDGRTLQLVLDPVPERGRLSLDGEVHVVQQARTASGVRYESVVSPGTWLWLKGDRATLSLDGRSAIECRRAGPAGSGS